MKLSESEPNGPAIAASPSLFARARAHAHVLYDIASIYGVQFANYIVPLVTVPYLARVLGPTSWGLIAMAQALSLYGSLVIEYGFVFSATRQIVTASSDREIEEIIASVSGAKASLAVLVTAGAYCAYWFIPLFHSHPVLLWTAVSAEIIKASLPSYFFFGIKRVAFASALEISARVVAGIGIFFFVHGPKDAWKFFGLQIVGAAAAFFVGHGIIYMRYAFRWPKFGDAMRMLQQGSDVFLLRSAHNIYVLGNAFILGLFVSPQAVGYYSGAEKINSAAAGLLSPLSTALYPRAAGLVKTSLPKAALLTRLSLYAMLGFSLCLTCVMWFGASLIVGIFLGHNFGESDGVLRILSLRTPLVAFMNVLGFQWLLALGMERSFQRVTLIALALNAALATCFAPRYSYNGMAWCVVASQAVAVIGILLVLHRRKLNPLSMTTTGATYA